MPQATVYDVAAMAGVSIATVSRVLNAPEKVNAATRARVQSAIDALGFVPRAEAAARARKQQGRIGVLAPFFTYPSFVQRLRGVSEAGPVRVSRVTAGLPVESPGRAGVFSPARARPSAPLPPSIVSLPSPPVILSSPFPPLRVLVAEAPVPPVILSSPSPPSMLIAPAPS